MAEEMKRYLRETEYLDFSAGDIEDPRTEHADVGKLARMRDRDVERLGPAHRQTAIKNFCCIDLSHSASVIRQYRQETNEFSDFLFGIAFFDVKIPTVVRYLPQSPVEGKVKDIALAFNNLLASVLRRHFPRTLYAECSLKIGFRAR